jgi:hypothetical protein
LLDSCETSSAQGLTEENHHSTLAVKNDLSFTRQPKAHLQALESMAESLIALTPIHNRQPVNLEKNACRTFAGTF